MTKIFTIGFSGKSPEAFLDVLNAARISCVWDIRQWRTSTYVPYYNGENLVNVLGNHYEYHPEFAPTSDILAGYKDKKINWCEYEKMYRELLQKRNPLQNCDISKLDRICLFTCRGKMYHCDRTFYEFLPLCERFSGRRFIQNNFNQRIKFVSSVC